MNLSRFGERVLVVAVESGEHLIGCGGLMFELARAGAQVQVAYILDGSIAHQESRISRDELAGMQMRSAANASRILGIRGVPTFYSLHVGAGGDVSVGRRKNVVRWISGIIEMTRVLSVFAPRSPSADRNRPSVAAIVDDAIARATWPALVWQYTGRQDAGVPLPSSHDAECVVSLSSDAVEAKQRALRAYRTQITMANSSEDGNVEEALLGRRAQAVGVFYPRLSEK